MVSRGTDADHGIEQRVITMAPTITDPLFILQLRLWLIHRHKRGSLTFAPFRVPHAEPFTRLPTECMRRTFSGRLLASGKETAQ